ncbi:hypothetical protein [Agarivorans sp. Z349TD_8]|uniref:hypothetical protein n=1 Tax=Agarivorans sp. Z349TD_8 TaxID=3421434 RepID=UPI003D7D2192
MAWALTRTQWVVLIGLLFNIVAALMTNFYIDRVSQDAHGMVQRQQQHDKLIGQTWQQVDGLERKRELIYSLLASEAQTQRSIPVHVQQLVAKDLQYWLEQGEIPAISLDNLASLDFFIDKIQNSLRQRIDHWYLQNIDLSSRYTEQMATISALRNLALFLQIIGLALILARDLSRH